MNSIIKSCEKCKKSFYEENPEIVWCSDVCKEKLHLKYCKKCDKKFFTYQKTKVYCSDNCRIKRCTVCNQVYLPKGTESYCSAECKEKKYTHKCLVCEEHFFKQVPSAKFCSLDCRNVLRSSSKKFKSCMNCGKILMIFSKHTEPYCHEECYKEYMLKVKAGKVISKKTSKDEMSILLEERVRGKIEILITKMLDPSILYTFNTRDMNDESGFTETLKEEVKERENYCCYICEGMNSLEVHHIIKQKHGGNHEKSNLVALCRKCHRHIETGNKEYAFKKCLQNAKNNLGIIDFKLKDKINRSHALSFVKLDVEETLEVIIQKEDYELMEIILRMNEILDQLEEIE